jgi:chromosome partitioning protein
MFVYAILGQKGGGGKTSTAVSLGTWHAQRGKLVFFGDTDLRQQCLTDWLYCRKHKLDMTSIVADTFAGITAAMPDNTDVLIIDGKPNASDQTLLIARRADRIIIPCGSSRSNLVASANLADQLVAKGISRKLILFAITPTASPAHRLKAINALEQYGHTVAATLPFSPEFESALDDGRSMHEATERHMKKAGRAYVEALISKHA